MSAKKTTALKTAKQYWSAANQHPRDFRLAFLHPAGSLASNVAVPFFGTQALASIFTSDGKTTQFIVLTAISAVITVFCNRFGFDAITRLQAKTLASLNERMFSVVISRGMRFHVNNISGKTIADVMDYVHAFSAISMAFFTTATSLFNMVLIGLIVILVQSWQLGLFMLVIVVMLGIWAYYNTIKRSRLRRIRHEATRELTSHMSDSIVNAQTIKTFAQESVEEATNQKLNTRLKKLRISDWHYGTVNGNNRIAVLMAGSVVLLVLLNHLSKTDPSTLGAGLFTFTYTMTLILRLFEVDVVLRIMEENLLKAAPMTEIIEEEVEVVDTPNATTLKAATGTVEFDDVTFHYQDSEHVDHVFENFHLRLSPGEKIGLVGPSGGGKSTLTKILLRFDDIQSGQISIDGQDISTVTQASLRGNISYVPQEPLLFHRSIAENIAYSNPGASKKAIEDATKKAEALGFVKKLPNGFDTVVGERGVKLSGGQRQRIAIARAMLKNAPILVLDEATSALDSESERLVQKSIGTLMKGKTAIVIAHRLSTIQKMDRIVVLDSGKIVEEGTHSELIKKKNGHYARLWSHQSGGFLED